MKMKSRALTIVLIIALVFSTLTLPMYTKDVEAAQTIPVDFNENLIKDASLYLGLRYKLGGRNPSVQDQYEGTLDCSGYVQRVLLDMGVSEVPWATGGHSKGSTAGWNTSGWLYKVFNKTLSLTYNGVKFNAANGNMIFTDTPAAFDAAINNPDYNGNTIVVLRVATSMSSLEPYMKTGMIILMSDIATNNVVTQAAHMMMVADTIEPDANTNAASSVAEKTVRYADQAAAELKNRFVGKSLYSGTNYIYKTCQLGFESSAYSAYASNFGKRYQFFSNTPFTGHQDFYCVINHAQDQVRSANVPNDGVGSKVWYIEAALSPHSVCFSNKASALGQTPVYAIYFNSHQSNYYATMNVKKNKVGSTENVKNATYAWSTSKDVIAEVAANGSNATSTRLIGSSFDYDDLKNGYCMSSTGEGGIASLPPVCFGKQQTNTVYLTEYTGNGSGHYFEVSLNGTGIVWGANTSVNGVTLYKINSNTGIKLKNEVSDTEAYYQYAGTIVIDRYTDSYYGFELQEKRQDGTVGAGSVYAVTTDEKIADKYYGRHFGSLEQAKYIIGNNNASFLKIDENGKATFSSKAGEDKAMKVYVFQVVSAEGTVPADGYLEMNISTAIDEGNNIENALKNSKINGIYLIKKNAEGEMTSESYDAFSNSSVSLSVVEVETVNKIGAFTDLNYDSYYIDHVRYVFDNGIITGLDEKTFDPQGDLTRTMAITILYRMAGSPEVEVTENPFPDVRLDSWYTEAIQWAKDNGITNGYTKGEVAGTFGIRDFVTRQDFMKMLYSYAEYMEKDIAVENEESYMAAKDAWDVSGYASVMVNWGYEKGFIGNNSPLSPKNNINRAQTATIISRFLQTNDNMEQE